MQCRYDRGRKETLISVPFQAEAGPEDVANLLAENGIRLTLDGFTWDTERIHPFRKGQLYSSGRQGVI